MPPKIKFEPEKKNLIERAGDEIQTSVQSLAISLDSLLSGPGASMKEKNKTKATISQQVVHREEGRLETSTDFALNLRLPNLEKKWQLRFTSYDEEAEERARPTPYSPIRRDKRYGAGVGFFRNLGRVKVSFRPRLVLRDPLEMSYVLRFETSSKAGPFRLRVKTDLFADAEKGTGEYVEISGEIQAGKTTFTTTHREEYKERGNEFSTGHSFTTEYPLTQSIGLYQVNSFSSSNRPEYHLTGIDVSAGFGQVIRPDRLYYSFGPSLNFSKSRRFKGEAAISLSASLVF